MYSRSSSTSSRGSSLLDSYDRKKRDTISMKLNSMEPKTLEPSYFGNESGLASYISSILSKWVKSVYPIAEKQRISEKSLQVKSSAALRTVKKALPSLQRLSYIEAAMHKRPPKTTVSTQLSELEAVAILTVFEDIYPSIGILETSILDEDGETSRILSYRTLLERFYGKPYDLPLIAGRYEVYDAARETKRRECVKITRILKETTKELLKEGSYTVLQHAALIPFLEEREENDLIDGYKEKIRNINSIRETIKDFRAVSRAKSDTHKSQRCRVKGYCRRMVYFNGIEDEYMDKWINSRKFQNTYRLKREEVQMENTVEDLHENIKHTIYAHENIMTYYRKTLNNIIDKIDKFDQRHEKDKETVELISEGLKMEIKSTEYLKEDAQHAYDQVHEKDTRLRERRARVIAEERLYRRQEEAVRKIARWWRRIYPRVLAARHKKKGKGKKGKK